MEHLQITCPHCGFSKELPADKAPPKPVTAKCPKCGESFTFDPATAPRSGAPQRVPPPSSPGKSAGESPREEAPAGRQVEAAMPSGSPGSSSAAASPRPVGTGSTPPQGEEAAQLSGSSPTPLGMPRPAKTRDELRGIGELLGDAWQLFQRRFGVLFAIYLLFLLAAIIPPLLGAGIGLLLAMVLPVSKGGLVAIGAMVGGVAGIAGLSCGWGALVAAALDESLGVRDSFAKGWSILLPFAWVCFLAGFVITGGFLLLIIPGIIFSVWFFFAQFVLVDDDTRGMSSLFKSRALTAGHWFDIFLRLLVIWTCSGLVSAIPVVGALLMLVAVPYVLLYQALLYKDLKEVAGPVVYPCGAGDTAKVAGIALLGYILIPAVIAATVGVSFYQKLAPLMGGDSPFSIQLPSSSGGDSVQGYGEYRVIPIPGKEGESPLDAGGSEAASEPVLPEGVAVDRQKHPEHIHVFIYSVNYSGSVKANGEELKELGTKPDMQYNYNFGGDKLAFGRNSITVDYSPLNDPAGQMPPRLHIKISYWNGNDKQVLGEWEIKDAEPGQKSFDIDIAGHM